MGLSVSDDNIIPFNQYTNPDDGDSGEQGDDSSRGRASNRGRKVDDPREIECAEMRRESTVQVGHGMKERGWTVDSPPSIEDYRWEAQQNMDFTGAKMGKKKVHPLAKTAYFHSAMDPKEHFSSDMSPAAARNEREYQLKMQLARRLQHTSTPRPSGV